MTVAVVTAVSHRLEAGLATTLGVAPGVSVVRRCADVAELLAVGAAGVAEVAVVSADLRGLERDVLRRLAGGAVHVAGLVDDGDDEGERRLRQLGVSTILRPSDDALAVGERLIALVDRAGGGEDTQGLGRDHAGSPDAATGPSTFGSPADSPGPAGLAGRGAWGGHTDGDDPLERLAQSADSPMRDLVDDEVSGAGPGLGSARRGRVTAVWGPTGAPGRTTMAVTLASHLAAAGQSTLLVDLDTWGAAVAQQLAVVDEAPGVAAAARASEQGTLDVPALARLAPEVTPGLRVLTGLPRADRWVELRAAAVEDTLELARRLVDHVVVDCGFAIEDDEELSYDTAAPRRNATTLVALEQADDVVCVGAADPVGLQRLVRAVQDLALLPAPAPVVVVNKVRSSVAGPRPQAQIEEVLGRFAGLERLHFVPWEPDTCDAALLAGHSLVEHAPQAPVTRAIRDVGAVLSSALAPPTTRAGRGRAARSPGRLGGLTSRRGR